MKMEESITTNVKVSDAEIDNLVGRGIIRVLRYIGYFAYKLANIFIPYMYYGGVLIISLSALSLSMGYELENDIDLKFWAIGAFVGVWWFMFERAGFIERLAKWLKIDEV